MLKSQIVFFLLAPKRYETKRSKRSGSQSDTKKGDCAKSNEYAVSRRSLHPCCGSPESDLAVIDLGLELRAIYDLVYLLS